MDVKIAGVFDSVGTPGMGDNSLKQGSGVRGVGSQEDASREINNNKREITEQELDKMTQDMNKFMQDLNADLHFKLHEKTQRLMVQLVDSRSQSVLKEFPPHEFLDTIAKISEAVGAFLDKKV
ncbi:MAG: hypothetical protein H6Q74_2645 [Firmicutes bacterium]|nr:hypothetical protein [Bacillota bacterium]